MSAESRKSRLHGAWLVVIVLCLATGHLLGENGRNFAGSYQIRNATEEGSVVKFQLSVKICNYSGGDVSGATLSLASREPGPAPSTAILDYQGSFTGVSVRYRKVISLQGTFTVPVLEYQQWQRGAYPNLVVEYLGQSGETVRSSVELSRIR